jgi:hypothetical protein
MVKNKEKDILLICKGHYNSDKHKTTYDALKAYQCEYTDSEEKYMPDSSIFSFILDTAKVFFKPLDWERLIRDGFVHDMEMAKTGIVKALYPEKIITLSYKYLIDTFISSLSLLPVGNNNEWIIDLSEYKDIEEIV